MDRPGPLTKKEVIIVLTLGSISIIISLLMMIYSEPVVEVDSFDRVPTLTVTPLDSPNPCWDPHFWSKAV